MAERDRRTNTPNQGRLTVVHGANTDEFDTQHGGTVGAIEDQFRDVLSIPTNSTPILDGQEVDRNTPIGDESERLEFTRRVGSKA